MKVKTIHLAFLGIAGNGRDYLIEQVTDSVREWPTAKRRGYCGLGAR